MKNKLFNNNKIERYGKLLLISGYIMLISAICGICKYIFTNGIDLMVIISSIISILTSIFIIRKSNLILEKNRYNISLDFVKTKANNKND